MNQSSDSKKNFGAIKTQIKNWVEEVVIGLNLCPFAAPSWSKGHWKISIVPTDDHFFLINEGLKEIKDCVLDMRTGTNENLLLVMPECTDDFLPFLSLCSIIELELESQKLLQEVQMVVFHPHFQFEGTNPSDRGNYVNRSPYPMIHILKKTSMDAVVERFGESIGEEVSLKNNDVLIALSDDEFQNKIQSYFDQSSWKVAKNKGN